MKYTSPFGRDRVAAATRVRANARRRFTVFGDLALTPALSQRERGAEKWRHLT